MSYSASFSGKTALVSGGGSGIGLAIARALLLQGAEVYICSRKQDRLDKALIELSPLGTCHALACDIREPEQVLHLHQFIKEHSGKLDILVNNAGGQFPSPAEQISDKGWNAVINTNLNGTWYMTRTMAQGFFLPQRQGVVVNIIANIFRGFPGMAHTGAARAAVENLTRTLAVEWASKGVRINAVAPGIIRSSGLEQYPPQLLEGISDKIPMKRLGSVEDVAHAVLFLASDMASYITGDTLYVDGGSRLWGDVWELG
jgi:citronellol/citronellal dehydrogenase